MRRIAIVGSGGAGKSTLAGRLGEITGIEVYHLDKLFWQPGWVRITKEELASKVIEIIKKDFWIIDGNYSGTMDSRFQAADTIIFLDFPLWACLWGITRRRFMYSGRTRPCMTEGCDEKLDLEFILWVMTFHFKRRRGIVEKIRENALGKDVFIFKNRREISSFIAEVEAGNE